MNILVILSKKTCGGISLEVELLGYLLVFYCYWNKLPQTCLLNITQIYYLTIIEIRILIWVSVGQNPGVGRAVFLTEPLRENLFPNFLQLLESAHILWIVASFLCLQSQQCCISLLFHCHISIWLSSACPPLLRTPVNTWDPPE